jgi:hydroxyacylglutathione hydrolase
MPTIHPVVDEGLGNSASVVELGDGRALVVDPARDPTPYQKLARWRRLRIAYAVETHLHADFLTGSRELAAADGAQVLAPRTSRLGFTHRGLEDGEEVDLGGLVLRVLATPGHAPEHVSYLLLDDGRPAALFSGGALLVGTVARTDLAGPELTEPLARATYQSLQRLLPLPDELTVYPTHGAGSFCAAPAGASRAPPSAPNAATASSWPPPTRTPSWPNCWPGSAATRRTSCGCGSATGPARRCSALTGESYPCCRPTRSTITWVAAGC